MRYEMAMLVEVEADSFEEAEDLVLSYKVVDDEAGKVIKFDLPATEHDNEGQRVIYLHSEEEPKT